MRSKNPVLFASFALITSSIFSIPTNNALFPIVPLYNTLKQTFTSAISIFTTSGRLSNLQHSFNISFSYSCLLLSVIPSNVSSFQTPIPFMTEKHTAYKQTKQHSLQEDTSVSFPNIELTPLSFTLSISTSESISTTPPFTFSLTSSDMSTSLTSFPNIELTPLSFTLSISTTESISTTPPFTFSLTSSAMSTPLTSYRASSAPTYRFEKYSTSLSIEAISSKTQVPCG